MHRYHSDTIRAASAQPRTHEAASLGVYGTGAFVVFMVPGTYTFQAPVTGMFRARVVGAGMIAPGSPGGTSSVGDWLSATGGSDAGPGMGFGGDFRAKGGRGIKGGGSAGSFMGDGYNGGGVSRQTGTGSGGGGGGGCGGAGASNAGGGTTSNAIDNIPGTGISGLRASRFPTDILDGVGGTTDTTGVTTNQPGSPGGSGAGGGAAGHAASNSSSIGGQGGVLGGGGSGTNGVAGKGGIGGGRGGSYISLSGHGGGWAHGERQLERGTVLTVTVGAAGDTAGTEHGLVVFEW